VRLQPPEAVILPRDTGVDRAFTPGALFFRLPVPGDIRVNPVFIGVRGKVRHPVGVGSEKEDHRVDVPAYASDRRDINKGAGVFIQFPARPVPVVKRLSPGEIVVIRLDVPQIVPKAGRTDSLFLIKLKPCDRVRLGGLKGGFLRPEGFELPPERRVFGFKPRQGFSEGGEPRFRF